MSDTTDTMSDVLKPCPFCGGEPEHQGYEGGSCYEGPSCCYASVDFQIVDIISREDRYSEGAYDSKTNMYRPDLVEFAKRYAIEEWNKRSLMDDANNRRIDAGRHYPECNYWGWDWGFSWDVTDCTCPHVEGEYHACPICDILQRRHFTNSTMKTIHQNISSIVF